MFFGASMYVLFSLLACQSRLVAPVDPIDTDLPTVPSHTDAPSDTGLSPDTDSPSDTDQPADSDVPTDTDVPVDTDLPVDTGTPSDTGYVPSTSGLPRGLAWVRTNPLFVSGLTPHLDAPGADEIVRYYDDFGATATHLWEDGLPSIVDGWQSAGHPGFRWVSWVDRNGASHDNGTLIGGVSPDRPGRIGYQVGDEPRSWDQVAETDAGVLAVRAADPNGLIIVNLGTPDDFSGDFEEFVQHFAALPEVDVVSYDLYSGGYGEYTRLEIVRREALAHDKAYWRYLDAFHYVGDVDEPAPSDLRWDAFVGLLYGYTGHSWFVYEVAEFSELRTTLFDGSGSWSHTPNTHFQQVATLNRQLSVLGRAVTQLTSTDVRFIPAAAIYPPEETSDWSPGAGGDPYITHIGPYDLGAFEVQDTLIGFFEDDQGALYTMLQNPHRESSDWPLFLSPDADFRIEFDFSSAPGTFDRTRLRSLDKSTGIVNDLPLISTGPTTAKLEIRLDAGDVVLFKYADGMPFALQPAVLP